MIKEGGHTNCTARGTDYESLSEIPQEREKLLRLVQRALHSGKTQAVVFVSGDQHWAEFSGKEMSESADGAGDAQMVYELTGSGLAANWVRDAPFYNDNRLPSNRCDTRSDGNYVNRCVFPFRYVCLYCRKYMCLVLILAGFLLKV
jgi:alkaline phosphatase D